MVGLVCSGVGLILAWLLQDSYLKDFDDAPALLGGAGKCVRAHVTCHMHEEWIDPRRSPTLPSNPTPIATNRFPGGLLRVRCDDERHLLRGRRRPRLLPRGRWSTGHHPPRCAFPSVLRM